MYSALFLFFWFNKSMESNILKHIFLMNMGIGIDSQKSIKGSYASMS